MDAGFLLLPEFLADRPPRALRPQTQRRLRVVDHPTVRVRRLAPRDVVYAADDAADEVHEVTRGAILVYVELDDGRRQIIDVIGPGRLFGFSSVDRHRCTAVAAISTVVCSLDHAAASRHPRIVERMSRAAVAEIERLRELTLLLGRKTAMERVASFFVSLVGDDAAAAAEIDLPVTRGEIADHLGLTIETVSRNVTRLKRMGLIADDPDGRTMLPDCPTLRDLARGRAVEAA